MRIADRVNLYKRYFGTCKAVGPVKEYFEAGIPDDEIEALEALRALDTALSRVYEVRIPVITCWVRDSNYVPETLEIYLTEPDVRAFLHQFRHHLQNIERRGIDRAGLIVEGNAEIARLPYTDCEHRMLGEDDAVAWSEMLIEICQK